MPRPQSKKQVKNSKLVCIWGPSKSRLARTHRRPQLLAEARDLRSVRWGSPRDTASWQRYDKYPGREEQRMDSEFCLLALSYNMTVWVRPMVHSVGPWDAQIKPWVRSELAALNLDPKQRSMYHSKDLHRPLSCKHVLLGLESEILGSDPLPRKCDHLNGEPPICSRSASVSVNARLETSAAFHMSRFGYFQLLRGKLLASACVLWLTA